MLRPKYQGHRSDRHQPPETARWCKLQATVYISRVHDMKQRCGWTCNLILALPYSTRFRSFEMARKMRQLECLSRSDHTLGIPFCVFIASFPLLSIGSCHGFLD
ncbi:hypothetical protein LZ32DRAFT_48089 [Colletotrichum eremochloae]|nr:hypothetical protein LZ32DRAFT_48089 [Colletotrichum eremochloae]